MAESSFAKLRALADVLRLSDSTAAAVRPFATELFRPQMAFNLRVIEVLEDFNWANAAYVESRLAAWVRPVDQIPVRRRGWKGRWVKRTKQAALAGLRVGLDRPLTAMREANRAVVDGLKARRPPATAAFREALHAPGLSAWFQAQADFYDAVADFVSDLGDALGSYPAAFARFGEAHQRRAQSDFALPAARTAAWVRVPEGEALLPGAQETFEQVFAANPEAQLCYGDTVIEDEGIVALKPGWSPEYLLSVNYIGGCFAIRRGHPAAVDGAALKALLDGRFTEAQVVRVPWALSRRKTRAAPEGEAEKAVVQRHLGSSAEVELAGDHRRVRFAPKGPAHVTIIVPFKDKIGLLEALWSSMRRYHAGVPFDLLLVSNQSVEPRTFAFLEAMKDPRVEWFSWNHPYNWSAINNIAARRAKGDLLLFLNNDTQVTHDGWLKDLAGYATQPDVGMVGARLLYEERSIQHAGVAIGLRGLAGHAFSRWRPEYGPTPFGSPAHTRNWSAVTGACQLMRRSVFEELGGFDERLQIVGSDIELCVRLRKKGLRVVCAGDVVLIHYESISRAAGSIPLEDLRLEARAYAEIHASGDPYWHPQLSAEVGHGGLGPVYGRIVDDLWGRG